MGTEKKHNIAQQRVTTTESASMQEPSEQNSNNPATPVEAQEPPAAAIEMPAKLEALFNQGSDGALPEAAQEVLIAQADTTQPSPEGSKDAPDEPDDIGSVAGKGALSAGTIGVVGVVGIVAAAAAGGSSSSSGDRASAPDDSDLVIDSTTQSVRVGINDTVRIEETPTERINITVEQGVSSVTFAFEGSAADQTVTLDSESVLRGNITIDGGTLNVQNADVSAVESLRANSGIEIRPSQLESLIANNPSFTIGSDSETTSSVRLIFVDDTDTQAYQSLNEQDIEVVGGGANDFNIVAADPDPAVFQGDLAAARAATGRKLDISAKLTSSTAPSDQESGEVDEGQLVSLAEASERDANDSLSSNYQIQDSAESILSYLESSSDSSSLIKNAERIRINSTDVNQLLDAGLDFSSDGGLAVVYEDGREIFNPQVDSRLSPTQLEEALSNFDFVVLYDRLAPESAIKLSNGEFISLGLSDALANPIQGAGGTVEIRLFPESAPQTNPNVETLGFDLSEIATDLSVEGIITGESSSDGEIDLTNLSEADTEQFKRLESIKFIEGFSNGNVLVGTVATLSGQTISANGTPGVTVQIDGIDSGTAAQLDTDAIFAKSDLGTLTLGLRAGAGTVDFTQLPEAALSNVDAMNIPEGTTVRVPVSNSDIDKNGVGDLVFDGNRSSGDAITGSENADILRGEDGIADVFRLAEGEAGGRIESATGITLGEEIDLALDDTASVTFDDDVDVVSQFIFQEDTFEFTSDGIDTPSVSTLEDFQQADELDVGMSFGRYDATEKTFEWNGAGDLGVNLEYAATDNALDVLIYLGEEDTVTALESFSEIPASYIILQAPKTVEGLGLGIIEDPVV